MKKLLIVLSLLAIATFAYSQKDDLPKPITQEEFMKLAKTPPMGWNSWNSFHSEVSEKLLMETADAMVESGMKDAGYEYIIVDDCWQVKPNGRDADGNILWDTKKFPHGMKYVADYIHSKGLKFGIYSCAGAHTCCMYPGSKGYEYQDARFYASIGVDYLKYDFCYNDGRNSKEAYTTMREALKQAGRPIVLSICEWGSTEPWQWGKGIGHLWRISHDISPEWDNITDIINLEETMTPYGGPHHWNDPDMLEVGNGELTLTENISHFSLWCMFAAPLISGNDLRSMKPEVLSILTNKEAIAVDQDTLGVQAHVTVEMGDKQIWIRPLSDGGFAVCFFNKTDHDWNLDYNLMDISELYGGLFEVRDIWQHKNIGRTNKNVVGTIYPHGVKMLRLTPVAEKKK